MSRRSREVTAGIVTGLVGFALIMFGILSIQTLVDTNQLIWMLATITCIPGGIVLLMIGVKVVD